jgi:hypothetical protein
MSIIKKKPKKKEAFSAVPKTRNTDSEFGTGTNT